jgi:hypothetical protein
VGESAAHGNGSDGSVAAELDALIIVLREAVELVPPGGGPDRPRLVALLRAACDGCQRAAAESGSILPTWSAPDAVHEWLHDLRARVGTIAGWTRLLAQRRDEPTWLRTADVLERNAKILVELLENPPAAA